MRLLARLLLAAALATPPAIVALASCSTGAVASSACTTIEDYRCQAAAVCTPGFDVDRCLRFYRDQCLNGIQDPTPNGDPNALAGACVSALQAAAACAEAGPDSPCPAVALVPDASCGDGNTSPTACQIILDCPEVASACNFVEAPPDGGDAATTETADSSTNSADAASE